MGFWFKKVEWSPAGAGTFTDLSHLKTDASHTQEPAAEETAAGVEVYGGMQDVYEIPIYDTSKVADLRTQMLADGLVDLRFTDAEGTTTTETNLSVIVSNPKTFSPRTRAAAVARFVKSSV